MADNCSWGKKCYTKSCTKNHICTYWKKKSCTNDANTCKYYHGKEESRKASSSTSTSPVHEVAKPPKYQESWAQAFEDGLVANPVLLGVSAAAAEDPTLCPDIDPLNIASSVNHASISRAATLMSTKNNEIADVIAAAQQISICFVLDTTGSMGSHITGAKQQIVDIVARLKEKDCKIMAIAFVGYKDWCDGDDHFEVLQFSNSVAAFQSKLEAVTATGGGDLPEDVLGGLVRAVHLAWPIKSGSRLIFHIGDAPPHGHRYHDLSSTQDSYYDGHPKDVSAEDIFEVMRTKRIEYFFGEFGHGVCTKMKAKFGSLIGRDPSDMTYDVSNVAKIAESVTASALKVVSASAMVRADKASPERKFVIDPRKPVTGKLPEIEAISIAFAMPDTISQCCDSERSLTFIRKNTSVRIAPNPFSKGAVRLAYHGSSIFRSKGSHEKDALHSEDDVVLKEFIRFPANHKLDAARYFADLETQTIASKMAIEFSSAVEGMGFPFKLKFLKATIIRMPGDSNGARYMSIEKLYHGGVEMVKYTSNHKFVNTTNPADHNWAKKIDFLLAFSHFTYEKSRAYLVVTDLQGISGADIAPNEIILTDPAIHCAKAPRFGATNLMKTGIDAFISSHVCTPVCAALGLKSLRV